MKKNKLSPLGVFLVAFTLWFTHNLSEAASISQIKNGKALINLEGTQVAPNQEFYTVNASNKRTSLVRILQIRGDRAVGMVLKGNARAGDTLQAKSGGSSAGGANSGSSALGGSTSPMPTYDRSANYGSRNSGKATGKQVSSKVRGAVLLNMMMNDMSAVESDISGQQETVAMKGSTFGLTGSLDYPIGKTFTLRATAGYEPFSVTGNGSLYSCDNQTSMECMANITYLAAGGYLRYDIMKDPGLLWVAGGGTMRMPMGKASTALNEADIAMTATFGIAFGYDILLKNKAFIPLSFEYQMFMPSETVKTSFMSLRGGYGIIF